MSRTDKSLETKQITGCHGLGGKGRSYRAGWALVGKTDAVLGTAWTENWKSTLSSLKIKMVHD